MSEQNTMKFLKNKLILMITYFAAYIFYYI